MRSVFLIIGAAVIAFVIGAFVFLYNQNTLSTPSPSVAGNNSGTNVVSVPFTQLAQGVQSTVSVRANYLITSSTELSNLWNMIDAHGQTPVVDFRTHDVIAVFAGNERTAGYTISVSKVQDTTVRQVTVTVSSPGATCLLGQSLTAPYQVIELPKTSLTFTHVDIPTTTGCLQ